MNELELRFHAVGQGLFASGMIIDRANSSNFRWVYDCGTTSSQSLISAAIEDLRKNCGLGRPRLDLVVVSHFDYDHISGLVQLLKTFSVRTIVLPYMPLWQRLVVAFDAGISNKNRVMRFFINPIAYLTSLSDVEIEHIIVVPGAQGDDRASDDGDGNTRGNATYLSQGDDVSVEALPEAQWNDELRVEVDAGQAEVGARQKTIRVTLLKPGGALRWKANWEFVPYNDAHVSFRPVVAFSRRVASMREMLLKSPTLEILCSIKAEYDRRFGKSAKARNIISLFLYAGRIGKHSFEAYSTHGLSNGYSCARYLASHHKPIRASVIYTGDGYLDTANRIDRFLTYLRPHRTTRPLCFQVMHHGSRNNWSEGLANKLQPGFSIFSSDPFNKKLRHPHGEVVRDFLHYGPIQVDKNHSALIECFVNLPVNLP